MGKKPRKRTGRRRQSGSKRATQVQRASARFEEWGVDTTHPGFDLDPNFLAAEQAHGSEEVLALYGEFVAGRPRTSAYDARARKIVPEIAEAVFALVESDVRQGACVDASTAIGRMLDEEGIFNVGVKGSLTIRFPAPMEPQYFWTFDPEMGRVAAGHGWLFAPPFRIIDVTLTRQGWDDRRQALLTRPVIVEDGVRATPAAIDVSNPLLHGDAPRQLRSIERFVRALGCYKIRAGRIRLKYTACGVGMPDGALTALQTPIGGKRPIEIYSALRQGDAPSPQGGSAT